MILRSMRSIGQRGMWCWCQGEFSLVCGHWVSGTVIIQIISLIGSFPRAPAVNTFVIGRIDPEETLSIGIFVDAVSSSLEHIGISFGAYGGESECQQEL